MLWQLFSVLFVWILIGKKSRLILMKEAYEDWLKAVFCHSIHGIVDDACGELNFVSVRAYLEHCIGIEPITLFTSARRSVVECNRNN